MAPPPFKADPARHCPVSSDIVCGEEPVGQDDDMHEYGNYTFHMTIPGVSRRLDFSCRDPSCGVLVEGEDAAEKIVDGRVDPFLFEPDYYLEAKTGFQVWPGSRLLVEGCSFCVVQKASEIPGHIPTPRGIPGVIFNCRRGPRCGAISGLDLRMPGLEIKRNWRRWRQRSVFV